MDRKCQVIVEILHKIGMDRAIAYGSGARLIQAAGGIITLFFIAAFMTGVEQGYFYTFNSLLGIQVFFELGFTGILTQFVAHEASHLRLNSSKYEGDELYRSRLSSLLHFSLKWYSVAAVFMLVALLITSMFIFKDAKESNQVSWFFPYLILCIATAIKLLQSPFTAILMGLDKVTEMNKILFFQQIITPLIMWILLVAHVGLYVVGISSLVAVIVWFVLILKGDLKEILINVYKTPVNEKVDYFKEIFPYQWRMAISAFSGFFIFNFMTPIVFKYQGAIISGQLGMTITAVAAVQSLAMTWQNTKIPLYSQLIARREYSILDNIFNKTTRQMFLICIVLMICSYLLLASCDYFEIGFNGKYLSDRFLLGWPMFFMMVAYSVTSLTFAWATYLRCHKKEPYMWMSLFSGLICLFCIWITAKYYTIFAITLTYLIVRVIVIPWSYSIFTNKKKIWHKF